MWVANARYLSWVSGWTIYHERSAIAREEMEKWCWGAKRWYNEFTSRTKKWKEMVLSVGRRSACLPKRQRRQDSRGDGAVEFVRPPLVDEIIARDLLAPLFNSLLAFQKRFEQRIKSHRKLKLIFVWVFV